MEDGYLDYNDTTVCPYCLFQDVDCWELEGDSGMTDCPNCGEGYFYERNVIVKYTTRKRETT